MFHNLLSITSRREELRSTNSEKQAQTIVNNQFCQWKRFSDRFPQYNG
jgi:hypothetical protein